MWKMICYEWKKLLKSKTGILLVISIFLIMGWQLKTNMDSGFVLLRPEQVQDFVKDQKKLDNMEFSEIKDNIVHYDNEKDMVIRNHDRMLALDTMETFYGKNWKKIMEKYEEGTLTQQDIDENNLRNIDDDSQTKVTPENFKIMYTYIVDDSLQLRNELNPDANLIMNRKSLLYTEEKSNNPTATCFLGKCSDLSKEYYSEINRRIMNISDTYHPTVIPAKTINEMMQANILIIIIVSILIGNIFSKESAAKTDVYLSTTIAGQWKVTAAKLCVSLTIGVVLPMLFLVATYFLNQMQYGSFQTDIFYFSSSQITGEIVPYLFTIKELLIIVFVNNLIGFLSLSVVCLVISRCLKNSYASGIVCILLAFAPLYNFLTINSYNFNQWFPTYQLMRSFNRLSLGNELFINILSITIPRIWVFIIFWILCDIVLIAWLFYKGKKHEIANAT